MLRGAHVNGREKFSPENGPFKPRQGDFIPCKITVYFHISVLVATPE
jgi:hypothetical protein